MVGKRVLRKKLTKRVVDKKWLLGKNILRESGMPGFLNPRFRKKLGKINSVYYPGASTDMTPLYDFSETPCFIFQDIVKEDWKKCWDFLKKLEKETLVTDLQQEKVEEERGKKVFTFKMYCRGGVFRSKKLIYYFGEKRGDITKSFPVEAKDADVLFNHRTPLPTFILKNLKIGVSILILGPLWGDLMYWESKPSWYGLEEITVKINKEESRILRKKKNVNLDRAAEKINSFLFKKFEKVIDELPKTVFTSFERVNSKEWIKPSERTSFSSAMGKLLYDISEEKVCDISPFYDTFHYILWGRRMAQPYVHIVEAKYVVDHGGLNSVKKAKEALQAQLNYVASWPSNHRLINRLRQEGKLTLAKELAEKIKAKEHRTEEEYEEWERHFYGSYWEEFKLFCPELARLQRAACVSKVDARSILEKARYPLSLFPSSFSESQKDELWVRFVHKYVEGLIPVFENLINLLEKKEKELEAK